MAKLAVRIPTEAMIAVHSHMLFAVRVACSAALMDITVQEELCVANKPRMTGRLRMLSFFVSLATIISPHLFQCDL